MWRRSPPVRESFDSTTALRRRQGHSIWLAAFGSNEADLDEPAAGEFPNRVLAPMHASGRLSPTAPARRTVVLSRHAPAVAPHPSGATSSGHKSPYPFGPPPGSPSRGRGWSPAVGQEFGELRVGPSVNAGPDVGEVSFGVDPVLQAAGDQRLDCGGVFAAVIVPNQQRVLSSEGVAAEVALGAVVVE
jgi:hypothetical protein